MLVRITVHYPARGITSAIAIAIGPRVVYNVTQVIKISVVQKKMKFFCFCFKVLTIS